MKNMATFLKEVRSEMARVEWPKPEEFMGATIVTLLFVLFFTIYLGLVDKAAQWVIYKQLLSVVKS